MLVFFLVSQGYGQTVCSAKQGLYLLLASLFEASITSERAGSYASDNEEALLCFATGLKEARRTRVNYELDGYALICLTMWY